MTRPVSPRGSSRAAAANRGRDGTGGGCRTCSCWPASRPFAPGCGRAAQHAAKGGTLALAGVMFAAALARLALPESRAGLLASRKRRTDVVTLAALATGLLVAGLLLPVPL